MKYKHPHQIVMKLDIEFLNCRIIVPVQLFDVFMYDICLFVREVNCRAVFNTFPEEQIALDDLLAYQFKFIIKLVNH